MTVRRVLHIEDTEPQFDLLIDVHPENNVAARIGGVVFCAVELV